MVQAYYYYSMNTYRMREIQEWTPHSVFHTHMADQPTATIPITSKFPFPLHAVLRSDVTLPRTGLPATRSGATQHTNAKPPPGPARRDSYPIKSFTGVGGPRHDVPYRDCYPQLREANPVNVPAV